MNVRSTVGPEQLDLLTAIEEIEQGFADWDVFRERPTVNADEDEAA